MIYRQRQSIFGPPGVTNHPDLYQQGSGLASFFGSMFKKFVPLAGKAVKKIANSKILKEGGQHLLNTATSAAANTLGDIIIGEDPQETYAKNLKEARVEIGQSIKNANKRRVQQLNTPEPEKKKPRKRVKRKKVKYSVFRDGKEL